MFRYQVILKAEAPQLLLDVLILIASPASSTINFANNARKVIFCSTIVAFNVQWTTVWSVKEIMYVWNVLKSILCMIIAASDALFWIVYTALKMRSVIYAQWVNDWGIISVFIVTYHSAFNAIQIAHALHAKMALHLPLKINVFHAISVNVFIVKWMISAINALKTVIW